MNWREMPSLAALRAFEAAARHGSLSKAAAELNVTHAAVAQHLRTLDAHLGGPLMIRSGRGMVLTELGSQLAGPLSDGFARILRAVGEVSQSAADAPLTISVTPAFADNWLMPRLADFWTAHPDIALSITPSTDLVDLRRDGVDLAIRFGRGGWPGLESSFLVSGDYAVVGAPRLLAGRTVNGLADLSDLPWLFEAQHRESRRWAESNGLQLSGRQGQELATMTMVLAATRAGAGLSIQARALIAADLESGTLQVALTAPQQGLGYYSVTRPGVQKPSLRTFLKWLRAQT